MTMIRFLFIFESGVPIGGSKLWLVAGSESVNLLY